MRKTTRRHDPDTSLPDVLKAFGLSTASEISPAGGTAGRKWTVRSDKGRFVVRVRPEEFADDGSVGFDHAALRRMSDAGLPVPAPLARPDGSTWLRTGGEVYEVLHFVAGEPFVEGDVDAIRGLGEFLARFHSALSGDVPPGKQGRLREDHPDLLEEYLENLRALALRATQARQLDAIDLQLALVREQLDSGLYASLPQAVIHGDVHPGNVRFRDGRVAAVYDFDYLSVQASARDVCDGLVCFASERDAPLDPDDIRSLTQPFRPDPDRCGVLLDGYQGLARLNDLEWRALPLLMRSRWIQMRLRGSRKIPDGEKISYVLERFCDVIDWLDRDGPAFFDALRGRVQ